MNKTWKGFVFLDVSADLLKTTHDIGYGLTLRKASLLDLGDSQLEACFRMWSERRGTSVLLDQRTTLAEEANAIPQVITGLSNPHEWRHAVIESSNKNIFFWNVNLAFAISSSDLRMGHICFEDKSFSSPFIEFPMLNIRSPLGGIFRDYRPPSLDDLPELRENISYVLSNMTREFPPEIKKMIDMFVSLDNLPDSSQFKVLGYFAVIEGLMSHSPQDGDRIDSIQRQLVRNINLLNNRLRKIRREIRFDEFCKSKVETVLKRFYAYRSAIAHGDGIESSLKRIGEIRLNSEITNVLWVHDWLRDMTKKLILAAIIEPELVMDLK
jgi:hypothetical protein